MTSTIERPAKGAAEYGELAKMLDARAGIVSPRKVLPAEPPLPLEDVDPEGHAVMPSRAASNGMDASTMPVLRPRGVELGTCNIALHLSADGA